MIPTAVAEVAAQDLFVQISSDNPANILNGAYVHPVTPLNVASTYLGTSGLPIETNNFYGNLLVGDGTEPLYAMPYAVFWQKGQGLCAWNTDSTKYVFGTYSTESTPGPHYYYSGVGNCPVGFSSAEMNTDQTVMASNLGHQSVDVIFTPSSNVGSMTIPLVQGNAFLTSLYTDLTPEIFSGGAFTSFAPVTFKAGTGAASGMSKYRITINNGDTWLVYLYSNNGGSTTMTQTSTSLYTGPAGFSGMIQMAKLPLNYVSSDEEVFDSAAGTYATQNVISGTALGSTASYNFNFEPASVSGNPLLSFLFPHQVASISTGTPTTLKLWSNTKGLMQGYLGSSLTFTESDLPTDIQFLPWSPLGNLQNYSVIALQAIAAAANVEAAQVMSQQTDLNSMYYSGKALAKFAQICLTLNDVLDKDSSSCVQELEENLALFISNQNQYPLVYDTVWKGAISSCGDSGCDFGNAWYNDHHFHYGYFVYTAAVIAHIDPTWLTAGNKAYINTLIRDFANPSTSDEAFPQFRSFDWYAGHSWAHGITASADGKDEESSSEDYNGIYGMKLWGQVIGDASMEARGNLMLAVMRRSMQSYMLMSSNNAIQPASFVPQYAAGITFMNKIDHQTYFGQNEEYIEGIHMLPLTPISAYIRTPTFVAEEWSAVIEPILSGVQSGWLGILMANLAISNSTASFEFFSSASFSSNYLDGGASLTWYLTYAAGLGGAGDFQLAVGASDGQVTTSAITVAPSATRVSGSAINVAETSTSVSEVISTGSSSSEPPTIPTSLASSTRSLSLAYVSSLDPEMLSSPIEARTSAGTGFSISVGTTFAGMSASTSMSSITSSSALSDTLPSPSGSPTTTSSSTSHSQSMPVSIDLVSATEPAKPSSTLSSSTVSITSIATEASAVPDSTSLIISTNTGLFVSCPDGSLVLGTSKAQVILYANGTLMCGNRRAFVDLQINAIGSLYNIDLMLNPISSSLASNFTLNGTSLLLYVATSASTLSKRQNTAEATVDLDFAYGSDAIIKAVPIGQNTTLTKVQLLALTQISIDTSSAESSSSTASTSDSVSSTHQYLQPATSTTSTTVVQTFTSSVTTILSSTVASAAKSPTSDSAEINDGLAIAAQADATSQTGTITSATLISPPIVVDTPSSTTVSYTTVIDGQATIITTVVPVPTVLITTTYTTTMCSQCISTSITEAAITAIGSTTVVTVITATASTASASESATDLLPVISNNSTTIGSAGLPSFSSSSNRLMASVTSLLCMAVGLAFF